MPQCNATPCPESIDFTSDELREYADRQWETHSGAAYLILFVLSDELRKQGLFHTLSLHEIATDYGWCTTKVFRAGLYLAERNVIALDYDTDSVQDDCMCSSCQCRRCQVRLPFDVEADRREVQQYKKLQEGRKDVTVAERSACQRGYVYLLQSGDRFKIGITTDVDRRLKQLRSQQPPFPIELVRAVLCEDPRTTERALHDRFRESRVHGEWFAFRDPETVDQVIRSMTEWDIDFGVAEEGRRP